MSDEIPAGDPREPEYPAPESGASPPREPEHPAPETAAPPPRDPDASRRGVRAALTIFGAAVALHLLVLAFVKLSGNGENVWLFIPEGLLVIVAGLIASIVVTLKLPLDSRAPFWIAGVACMFASFIVWSATCAVAM
jgi:hypothetical protein